MPNERYRQIIAFAVRAGCLPEPSEAKRLLEVLATVDLRSSLSSIEIPTHILHGETDQIIPFSAGEYLASQLPISFLQPVPKIGHSPFFSQPQGAVDSWLEFLK